MTTSHTLDTPHSQQRAVPEPRYGDPVTDSDNTAEAKAAIQRINDAERAADAARIERDAAIVKMHRQDGLRPPTIARLLGVSHSNVRNILRFDAARRGDDRDTD